jgi:hypothetical protein
VLQCFDESLERRVKASNGREGRMEILPRRT